MNTETAIVALIGFIVGFCIMQYLWDRFYWSKRGDK